MPDGSFSIGSTTWPGTAKLLEEMGELTQVLGKLIAIKGDNAHWDGTDLYVRLYEEIGDVAGALEFFVEANNLSKDLVRERATKKKELFHSWHVHSGQSSEEAARIIRDTGA